MNFNKNVIFSPIFVLVMYFYRQFSWNLFTFILYILLEHFLL